jgi:hypothetical protein
VLALKNEDSAAEASAGGVKLAPLGGGLNGITALALPAATAAAEGRGLDERLRLCLGLCGLLLALVVLC